MRYLRTASFFLCLITFSCSEEIASEESSSPDSSEYFPLTVGNYWQLGGKFSYEVTGNEDLKGKNYHAIRSSYEITSYRDSTFYRVKRGKVYAIPGNDASGGEEVKFDLTAKKGDSWAFRTYTVTLQSTEEEITFKGEKIKNCYRFFLDDPRTADEEHWIFLAPGIGFVQYECSFCIQPVATLTKARINGVEL